MNLLQTQYPFDEKSKQSGSILLNFIASIALIGLGYFISEQYKKSKND